MVCRVRRAPLVGRSLTFLVRIVPIGGRYMGAGSDAVAREARRGTRVRLKVKIDPRSLTEPLTCEGETLIVNLHGA